MEDTTIAVGRRSFLHSIAGVMVLGTAGRTVAASAAVPVSGATTTAGERQTAKYVVRTKSLVSPEGPVVMADGSVLVCEMFEGRVSRVLPDGSVMPLPTLGGAPNGAAIGPDGACYVANNGGFNSVRGANGKLQMRMGIPASYKGGSIQRLDLATGEIRSLYVEADGRMLRGPNDLVFDSSGGFYFTDFGKILGEDSLDYGALYWARADGSEIRRLATRLLTPNGVALSPDQRTLYVTLTEKRQVLAYDIASPGRLATDDKGQVRRRALISIAGDAAFDSMKVEANGNLVVATLQAGCLSVFSPEGSLLQQVSMPEQGVTNLAFGGADLRTLYVTLTNLGWLIAVPWPRPGLRLQYQAS